MSAEQSPWLTAAEGGYGSLAAAFLQSSLEHMIPWLIVTCAVILCDLAFGLRKSLLTGEEVRFSSAARRTLGKMVTYFAFVMMVVMINLASGDRWSIDIYACLLVCFIELCSIISNLLAPKGIKFNRLKALTLFIGHHAHLDKDEKQELEEIIEKPADKEEKK